MSRLQAGNISLSWGGAADFSTRLKLWGIFFLYVLVAGYTLAHHELWGDEVHSWNIAKASTGISDVIANSRYEGHPPAWYLILWTISKFSQNLFFIQLAQFLIACSIVFIILFYSPFPFITRALLPFGYYFVFEYGIISRNYAIGILLALCICVILRKNFKYKFLLYYALLLLMTNTHLLAMLLAGSIHFYFLMLNIEQKKKIRFIALHAALGILIVLPSLYFIFPPSDSNLNMQFWTGRWTTDQLGIMAKSPLRVFMPIPAWWTYNFWNTQFLLQLQLTHSFLRPVTLLLSILFLGMIWWILKGNKKSLALFTVNLLLTFLVAVIFPLTTARYIGFIYIGFIVAYWMYCAETPVTKTNQWLVNILLGLQLITGLFYLAKDIQLPFARSNNANELLAKVPANEKIVTDYWCANTISAFTDKKLYCVGLDRQVSFLLWNRELKVRPDNPYTHSLSRLFSEEGVTRIYLISTWTTQFIFKLDPQAQKSFQFTVIDKRDDAIEKWSNIYLYEVRQNATPSGIPKDENFLCP